MTRIARRIVLSLFLALLFLGPAEPLKAVSRSGAGCRFICNEDYQNCVDGCLASLATCSPEIDPCAEWFDECVGVCSVLRDHCKYHCRKGVIPDP